MTESEVLLQQLITGLSNGMIIALLALGYTMVYGIIELINFAHGDLFMLGAFLTLTVVGLMGWHTNPEEAGLLLLLLLFVTAAGFCAVLNYLVDRLAYKPLRNAPRLSPLVSAIGVSFIFLNLGLFWGGLPLGVFNFGKAASAPKDFPALVSAHNLLGDHPIQFTSKELLVLSVTLPLLLVFTLFVKYSRTGKAMRAVAQNPTAAKLMGIDVERIIGFTFILGGALGGVASVVYAMYNNTIFFQMGFRVGIDAFTAAVLGGIGNLPGAMLGGVLIGLVRAMSDQYIATEWTNVVVFSILIIVLVFRPSGLLGAKLREKV
ncbi:MAG: branched-chain amino acid ABC transporter permease [Proteobacteria bacterium]|nr:MAG: branched-chain amino acid ABC transporter permease [Pseudomonadota bacterium]